MAAKGNGTTSAHFVLLGFSEQGRVQVVLFVVFLVICVITLLGNVALLVLIRPVAQLHTPMYFFLSSLSFLDLCCSSCITPRLLQDLLDEDKPCEAACLTQFYFYVAFATTECCLLAAMAYDRSVAVCRPLLYSLSVSRGICALLMAGSCLAGVTNAALHTGLALRLSFCGPKVIGHFYCEGPPLIALSCTDPALSELGMFITAGFSLAATVLAILLSYTFILAAVGKRKAFSASVSQLAAVALFYGSLVSVYAQSSSRSSPEQDKVASVFYTMVMTMLNPFICSLRNQEVKAGLWRLMGRKHSAEK
ncbi:olfactory receptor 1019-like [Pyrgilauda ruficollis]|uniref:olfactory receptor 1019-like n=1 Tax=Pyrgilauda ruficollis TaxID=221976 RepID=UPI001B8641D7|nr:olfactory receptor 1019-like [Pyrgilauda ruficollis]